jgi:hypothetical protein
MLMLLWLELHVARKATSVFNKVVVCVSSCRCGFSLLRFLFRSAVEARRGGAAKRALHRREVAVL